MPNFRRDRWQRATDWLGQGDSGLLWTRDRYVLSRMFDLSGVCPLGRNAKAVRLAVQTRSDDLLSAKRFLAREHVAMAISLLVPTLQIRFSTLVYRETPQIYPIARTRLVDAPAARGTTTERRI